MTDTGWHRKKDDAAAQARAAEYASPQYKAMRAAAKRQVDAGLAYCWRCRDDNEVLLLLGDLDLDLWLVLEDQR